MHQLATEPVYFATVELDFADDTGALVAKRIDRDRLFIRKRELFHPASIPLTDVRDSDLNLAKAELASAEADRDRARVEESAGTIRSPVKGRVIQVVARSGEAVGPGGVVVIADTSRMSVIAEIYETDIARVHPGQHAVVTSESFRGSIKGTVGWVSPQITTLNLPVDPSAPPYQRVYQARIDVDRPEALADRIHSKVTVLIEP